MKKWNCGERSIVYALKHLLRDNMQHGAEVGKQEADEGRGANSNGNWHTKKNKDQKAANQNVNHISPPRRYQAGFPEDQRSS